MATVALPRSVDLPDEVKEVIVICFFGIIAYLAMVCCIMWRGPARLAPGLTFDVDSESFVGTRPEEANAAYFNETRIETIYSEAAGFAGRIMVYHGTMKLRSSQGQTVTLDRKNYGTFQPGERFELMDRSEDVMFHISLFSREQSQSQKKHA